MIFSSRDFFPLFFPWKSLIQNEAIAIQTFSRLKASEKARSCLTISTRHQKSSTATNFACTRLPNSTRISNLHRRGSILRLRATYAYFYTLAFSFPSHRDLVFFFLFVRCFHHPWLNLLTRHLFLAHAKSAELGREREREKKIISQSRSAFNLHNLESYRGLKLLHLTLGNFVEKEKIYTTTPYC